jgi:hypothetical protein
MTSQDHERLTGRSRRYSLGSREFVLADKAKEKGRAQSCDRVRDPMDRICPYGEACISTSSEVCNKYKSLIQDRSVSEHRTWIENRAMTG